MLQSKKNILLLGGSGFIGTPLSQALLQHGHNVTVAARGLTPTMEAAELKFVHIHRRHHKGILNLFKQAYWDCIYDFLCFNQHDAKIITHNAQGQMGQYIMISSAAVYPFGRLRKESEFKPGIYPISSTEQEDYAQGKRQAEAYIEQKATFPATYVRFPFVIGNADPIGRLSYHIQVLRKQHTLRVYHPENRFNMISHRQAVDFLAWLVEHPYSGAINASAEGEVTLHQLTNHLASLLHIQPASISTEFQQYSPFALPDSLSLDCSLSKKLGFCFENWRHAISSCINCNE